MTANVEGTSAQEQITIVAAGSLAAGTVLWSAPSVPGFTPLQLAQAVPTNDGPDLYSTQISADGTQALVQALTADGQQLWQTQLPNINNTSVPDANGGLIVIENNTCAPNQSVPMTIADLDATTHQPIWQISAAGIQFGDQTVYCYPSSAPPQFAIRGDGAVIIAEPTNAGLPPLTVLDGQSGGVLASISIPLSSNDDGSGHITNVYSLMGPPMVNSDGSAYVEYQVRDTNSYSNTVTSAVVYLLKIAPDNSTTTIQLASNADLNTSQHPEPYNSSLLPGPIIPDGQGGVIATWTISPTNPPSPPVGWHYYQAADVAAGSIVGTYDLPFAPASVAFGV
ncbi:MAG TPA: PQQ-binding-like beta-propeller repeat protein, partial [Terriglobales bacterium]|nr:PQQ-binding-like beta-propeller repeat protein [Terriglobales bacterium]